MTPEAQVRRIIQPRKAEHFETLAVQEHAGRLGMWVFIASEILFFSALFTLYFSYRTLYPEAFAIASTHSDVTIGTINTFVLLTSSLTIAMSIHVARQDKQKLVVWLLAATLFLGVAFIVLKA